VSCGHILFCKRGKGLVTSFTAVCCTTLCSVGLITAQNSVTRVLLSQPQYEITGCKLTVIPQAAALSVGSRACTRQVNEFLCNKWLQQKLPDPFPLLQNGVWSRETRNSSPPSPSHPTAADETYNASCTVVMLHNMPFLLFMHAPITVILDYNCVTS